jgi:hypothetical protein
MMTSAVFEKTLVHGPHVRSFRIRPELHEGWLASEEADRQVIRRRKYTDWHRVEREVTRFRGEVAELRRRGWVDA